MWSEWFPLRPRCSLSPSLFCRLKRTKPALDPSHEKPSRLYVFDLAFCPAFSGAKNESTLSRAYSLFLSRFIAASLSNHLAQILPGLFLPMFSLGNPAVHA